jgi:protein-S-isoprenylcysteine O-methyltransferase Ste14
MHMLVGRLIVMLWVAFWISWIAAALWADRTERNAGFAAEAPYRAVLILGTLLFLVPAHGYHGWMRFWRPGLGLAWLCLVLMVIGFAFAWWARIHLGRLWSGRITRKSGHRIVESGPYALVRHPIYTGLLLAVLATMVVKGTLPGIAGAVLILVSVVMKAKLEETFLRGELGEAAYDDYRSRVPMLVPFT